jgi:hypothetical protein
MLEVVQAELGWLSFINELGFGSAMVCVQITALPLDTEYGVQMTRRYHIGLRCLPFSTTLLSDEAQSFLHADIRRFNGAATEIFAGSSRYRVSKRCRNKGHRLKLRFNAPHGNH